MKTPPSPPPPPGKSSYWSSATCILEKQAEDTIGAEYLKLAGDTRHNDIYRMVRQSGRQPPPPPAQQSLAGPSPHVPQVGVNGPVASPQAWQTGIIVPLWKRKGGRTDNNTWRGIVLLSVGSKVVARICALRLSRWSAPWLNRASSEGARRRPQAPRDRACVGAGHRAPAPLPHLFRGGVRPICHLNHGGRGRPSCHASRSLSFCRSTCSGGKACIIRVRQACLSWARRNQSS